MVHLMVRPTDRLVLLFYSPLTDLIVVGVSLNRTPSLSRRSPLWPDDPMAERPVNSTLMRIESSFVFRLHPLRPIGSLGCPHLRAEVERSST